MQWFDSGVGVYPVSTTAPILGTGFATSRRGNDSWENAQWDYIKRKIKNCINMTFHVRI